MGYCFTVSESTTLLRGIGTQTWEWRSLLFLIVLQHKYIYNYKQSWYLYMCVVLRTNYLRSV
jgi:hypothetical protein